MNDWLRHLNGRHRPLHTRHCQLDGVRSHLRTCQSQLNSRRSIVCPHFFHMNTRHPALNRRHRELHNRQRMLYTRRSRLNTWWSRLNKRHRALNNRRRILYKRRSRLNTRLSRLHRRRFELYRLRWLLATWLIKWEQVEQDESG